MKQKLLFGIGFLMMAAMTAFAQQDLNKTVQVSRTYEGQLMSTAKPAVPVDYSDTLNRFKLRFDYKFAERPYRDLYEFSPVRFASYQQEGQVIYPQFFANLSLAYPWMPEGDLYIQPRLGKNWSLVLYGNHRSFWGKVPAQQVDPVSGALSKGKKKPYGDRMSNQAGARIGYAWGLGDVSLGFDYGSHYRSYYGASYGSDTDFPSAGLKLDDHAFLRDSLSHQYDKMAVDVKLRSTNPDLSSFYYGVDLRYIQTKDRVDVPLARWNAPVAEHLIEGNVELGMTFQGGHRILLDIESTNALSAEDCGLLEVIPRYRYERGRWLVDAGFALSGMYAPEGQDLAMAHFYPDVSAYFETIEGKLWLYGRVEGDNVLNTRSSMLDFNPWLAPQVPVAITHIPLQGELGARGLLWNVFTFNFSCVYGQIENRMIATANLMQPIRFEEQVRRLKVLGSFLWKTRDFDGGIEVSYAHYQGPDTGYHPVMMAPSWEGRAYARYNLRERFVFSVDAQYCSAVWGDMGKSGVVELPSFLDLEARMTYVYNRRFSFYLKGDNLINATIQHIPGYVEPGINFGLGVCCKF